MTGRRGHIRFRLVQRGTTIINPPLDYAANADQGKMEYVDLDPGERVWFESEPYALTRTTNGQGIVHIYEPGKYMTHIAVWRNGFPSDQEGIPATTIFDSRALPLYLTSGSSPENTTMGAVTPTMGQLMVCWNPVSRYSASNAKTNRDVQAVALYRSTQPASVFGSDTNVVSIKGSYDPNQFYIDTNVSVGVTYYYGIKTINSKGVLSSTGSATLSGRVPAGVLQISPTNLQAVGSGAGIVLAGEVSVVNQGLNAMNGTISCASNWIILGSSSFILQPSELTNVSVRADLSKISSGTNRAVVIFSAAGADGSPQSAHVSIVKKFGPMASVSPNSRTTAEDYGQGLRTVSGSFTLSNPGDQQLNWLVSGVVDESGDPISFTNSFGSITGADSSTVRYSFPVNTEQLDAIYTAVITVSGNQINGDQKYRHYISIWQPAIPFSANFGVRSNLFGFNLNVPSGRVTVIDACTNLIDPVWVPLITNTPRGEQYLFTDPRWSNFIDRYYRIRFP